MFKYKTKGNNKRGFTLVELVIVIAVIAVLAAVLIPTFTNIINSANDSADTQLVANMNTALSTEVYADQTATAENLRKLLKDFGINDLTTRNKDNIIVYNQAKNRFEKINLKQVTIKQDSGSSVNNHSLMEDDQTTTLTIDPNPFSFAEIFEGYTIVSTGGNDLAEAVYGFYNLQIRPGAISFVTDAFKETWSKVCNIQTAHSDKIIEAFRKLVNSSVFIDYSATPTSSPVWFVRESIVQIDETNNIAAASISRSPDNLSVNVRYNSKAPSNLEDKVSYWTDLSSGNDRTISGTDVNNVTITPSRVFILETTTAMPLSGFSDLSSAVVVIPDTIENFIFDTEGRTGVNLSNIMFLGNTDVLGTDTSKLHGAQVSSMHIQEVKESVKTFGASVAQAEYYVSTNEENKDKPGYYSDLTKALETAGNAAKVTGLNRSVIIADKQFEITEDITVPQNVTLHVPYELPKDGNPKVGQTTDGAKTTLVDDELKTKNVEGYKYKDEGNYKQCTLTIAKDANLTVEGTLEVGAELSGNFLSMIGDQNKNYVSCVAGNYGQIDNSGTITVAPDGRLNAYGYIKCKDSGIVTVKDGAIAYEPIVVTDGHNLNSIIDLLNDNKKFPFMRYALPNITKLKIEHGGLLNIINIDMSGDTGLGSAIVGQLSLDRAYFVGSDKDKTQEDGKNVFPYGGLLTLLEGESGTEAGSVLIEYKYNNAVRDNNTDNNLAGDIGINTVTLNGNVQTGIVMNLMPNLQAQILSYIPYNFNYVISNGCTFNVTNKYAVLPGAQVTVKDGATLCVKSGGAFYVVDKYNEDGKIVLDGKSYPTADQLTTASLKTYGVVTLKSGATFKVESGASVGGTIQVESGAIFDIASDKDITGNFTVGAELSEKNSNAQTYNLPLQYKKDGEEAKQVSTETGTI